MVLTAGAQGAVGVGYEGRDLDGFLASLVASGVCLLADVRLTPLSRKRGFSKRALAHALASEGIAYEHLPALGNPKPNRAGFAGGVPELLEARTRYQQLIDNPDADRALDHLAVLAHTELVAVMCFEADEERCHRQVVLSELQQRLELLAVPI